MPFTPVIYFIPTCELDPVFGMGGRVTPGPGGSQYKWEWHTWPHRGAPASPFHFGGPWVVLVQFHCRSL